MKKIILSILMPTLVLMAACSKEEDGGSPVVEAPKKPTIGVLQAFTQSDANGRIDPPVTTIIKRTFGQPDSLYNFTINAAIADSGITAASDISIAYSVDNALAEVNLRRGIAGKDVYELLPDSVLNFPTKNSAISKGMRTSAEVSFSVSSAKIAPGRLYVVPVKLSVADTTQFLVNPTFQTAYIVVRAVKIELPELDRSAWKVMGFDSQEELGEGANNGRAAHCLDGNIGTYWQAQWVGAFPPFPHWISIDMGSPQTIHGFSFLSTRYASDGAKNVLISKSDDGVTWSDMASFTLEQTSDMQKVDIAPVEKVRYIKFTAVNGYSPYDYFGLAEFGAY